MNTKHTFTEVLGAELYIADNGDRISREAGNQTPNGNELFGQWVYRDKHGQWIDHDRYLNDLAARHSLSIVDAVPQQAPNPPRSTLIFIEDTNDTLEIFPVLQGQIEVRMRENKDPVQSILLIPMCRKEDVEWLYERCNTWRMATFRTLCEQLGKM